MSWAANVDRHLDVSGLLCPEPVMRARLALAKMHSGQVLEIRATDPLAEVDLRLFCERTGHRLQFMEPADSGILAQIRKR